MTTKAFWTLFLKTVTIFTAVSSIAGASFVAAVFIIESNKTKYESHETKQAVIELTSVVDSLASNQKKSNQDLQILVNVVKRDIKDRAVFNQKTIEKIEELAKIRGYETELLIKKNL